MSEIKDLLLSSVMFWIAWIIIPLIMEIIPAIGDFFILIKRRIKTQVFTVGVLSGDNADNPGI